MEGISRNYKLCVASFTSVKPLERVNSVESTRISAYVKFTLADFLNYAPLAHSE